ncbi:hypothetical protein RSP799_22065 [Ralstonia solanacearum]|nr:hypothetical protein RSP799_22065 [Ralstonia solanacearum]
MLVGLLISRVSCFPLREFNQPRWAYAQSTGKFEHDLDARAEPAQFEKRDVVALDVGVQCERFLRKLFLLPQLS